MGLADTAQLLITKSHKLLTRNHYYKLENTLTVLFICKVVAAETRVVFTTPLATRTLPLRRCYTLNPPWLEK